MISRFLIARWRQRSIIAYPLASRAVRLNCIRRLDIHTWKRHLLRIGLNFCCNTGLDTLIWRSSKSPFIDEHDVHFQSIFERCVQSIGEIAVVAVLWPPEPARSRRYLHFFDRNNISLGFGKVSIDPDSKVGILRDVTACNQLQSICGESLRIPSVLDYEQTEHGTFVVFESIPSNANEVSLNEVQLADLIGKYSGRETHVLGDVAKGKTWLKALLNDSKIPKPFKIRVNTVMSEGYTAAFVHGDFGAHNLKQVGPTIWIYDWESSSENGPVMTDYINLFLGQCANDILSNKLRRMAQRSFEFADRFITNGNCSEQETICGLAYLAAHKSKLARSMISTLEINCLFGN